MINFQQELINIDNNIENISKQKLLLLKKINPKKIIEIFILNIYQYKEKILILKESLLKIRLKEFFLFYKNGWIDLDNDLRIEFEKILFDIGFKKKIFITKIKEQLINNININKLFINAEEKGYMKLFKKIINDTVFNVQ